MAPSSLRLLLAASISPPLLLLTASAVASNVTIAPITILIPANGNQASVWLTNDSDHDWHAEAHLYSWAQVGDRDLLEPAEEVRASPPQLSVPAHSRQLLRVVRLGPPPRNAEQSYRLVIEERIEDAAADHDLLRFSSPVFAAPTDPPPITPGLTALISGEQNAPLLLLRNPSALHARVADLTFIDASGKRTVLFPSLAGYVLPGQSRTWPLPGRRDQFLDGRFLARINNLAEAPLLVDD